MQRDPRSRCPNCITLQAHKVLSAADGVLIPLRPWPNHPPKRTSPRDTVHT